MENTEPEIVASTADLPEVCQSQQVNGDSVREAMKHKCDDDLDDAVAESIAKRIRLDEDEEGAKTLESLSSLKSLCESVDLIETPTEPPTSQPLPPHLPPPESSSVVNSEEKTVAKSNKKKKKRVPKDAKDTKVKEKPEKKTKKSNMRKNIRDIFKDDELEAETRAAQQRELERVQRLQHQQQRQILDSNFVPSFSDEVDDLQDLTPATTLVEDLQALAKELEDSSLSPNIPLPFPLDDNHEEPVKEETSVSFIKEEEKEEILMKPKVEDDDVICLSSDEEAAPPKPLPPPIYQKPPSVDDDDVVILDSGDEEDKDANEDDDGDVNNFGLHTRDHLNQPDSEGRVHINVGHPANEHDIFLAPQLARAVKPHQIGGIRFLYDNVVESLEQYSISTGFGCILAHSMGLGKTFQVVAFCDVFLRNTGAKTVLIIVPINTIQNWLSEFNSWLPSEELKGPDQPDQPPVRARSFVLHVLNDTTKDINSRSRVIGDWTRQGGVLLLGYEMYRLFYTQRQCKQKKRGRKKKAPGVVDIEEEEKEKEMLERIHTALVDPGPDLVICDEGHRIKNMKASISVALKEIRTRRRVVLTGYPLQNNLLEYWCMVDFVRPNFLGTRAEFGNMFERPIQNGQCVDSSPADVKLMKERVYVLHSLVKGFVQRRSHAVLRSSLPHKEEHVLLLRMTPLQRALYRHYMSDLIQNKSVSNPLKAFAICCKIWNHPDVLYNFLKKRDEDLDLDLDEVANENKKKKNASQAAGIGANPVDQMLDQGQPAIQTPATPSRERKEEPSFDWASEMMKGYIPGDIGNAAKTQVFFTILEESVAIGDRLLVFSQSLFTLTLLEEFLQQRTIPGRQEECWAKNRSYFRLDGSTNAMEREKLVNEFNSNRDVLLFLISTRAGSLGINLVGANRVVVFDASWNPCHDAQAVCRVYRYGQTKQCFIYRLVTDNSLEKKIYDRQIGKQGTADRVVDELNPEARLSLKDVTCLVCDDEDDPPELNFDGKRNDLTDCILENVIQRWGSFFTKDPFHHDALLVESKESKLSKAEKRMAQRLYEKAKQDGNMQYRRQNYSNFYPKVSIPADGMYNNNRMNPPYYPVPSSQVRQLQNGPKPFVNSPLQGLGIDMLAEALAQGKLVCKEMVLTKDVTIARNAMSGASSSASGDGSSTTGPIILPTGTRVKLIKTPKGIYMQTPEGKIFRIHSSAPATPASPSSIAAALGIGAGRSTSSATTSATSQSSQSKSGTSLVDPTMLKRIRDMQQKSMGLDDAAKGQKVISFSDKNTLLAQIRHNLTANKGTTNAHQVVAAKQLVALAKKTTSETGAGNSQFDDNSLSPKPSARPSSSLLDPKARALPSASLPKKVATVSPNLSKARVFTPHQRPTAAIEPMAKQPVDPLPKINDLLSSSASSTSCAPVATSSASVQSAEFVRKNSADATADARSGLFDNLSLASQLEGFASCPTSEASSTTTAGNLKDLLLKSTTGNQQSAPEAQMSSHYQWSGDQSSSNDGSSSNSYAWPDYSWNTSWNANNQWPNQWAQSQDFNGTAAHNASTSAMNATSTSSSSRSSSSTISSENSVASGTLYNGQYSHFGGANHWPSYNNSYPSHSPAGSATTPAGSAGLGSATQYPITAASSSFYPAANPYFGSSSSGYSNVNASSSYVAAPQQPNYPNLSANYHQYSNNFAPGYSYPGSFSQ